ncbi:MAG: DUF1080 domain-containing protein [Prevotella sp.]|jgi:hypothetical protein|nr:DUF1080 domain-containing protein [Prevotella sp.]
MKTINFTELKYLSLIILSIILFSCHNQKEENWTDLLDKDLSQWDMYLSYEMKNGYNGDINGDTILPIGYGTNYKNIFTVIEDNNEPVLKISGEVYGCVFTKESYRNYHLRLKFKWGDKKWEPRLDKDMDSGILYHSQGECGIDYWRTWMLSHEFQFIQSGDEGNSGDYWCIGATQMTVRAHQDSAGLVFDTNAPLVTMGVGTENGYYCAASNSKEQPTDQWNEAELICFEGKSLHIVNGKVTMALSGLSYKDGDIVKPLIEGKIQLQSEAAEVFYKDIQIRDITQLPEEYLKFFE